MHLRGTNIQRQAFDAHNNSFEPAGVALFHNEYSGTAAFNRLSIIPSPKQSPYA